MYDSPLIGFASAADPLFEQYKDPKVIGKPYMTPEEWLPGAQTVVSMFLPFTKEVKQSNRGNPEETANEWLH
ncbi:MAG: epoxyqueuosine reductase, partial [Clostridia bacterium]|nr:epoxyqueuosine reductase [Clostridia bacterium]